MTFPWCRRCAGILMPPGVAADVVAYYEDLFQAVVEKRRPGRNYLDDKQFEDGYMKSAELVQFFGTFTDQMRGILKEAGIKVLR